MGALGAVALVVLLILVACVVAAWMALAIMPGRIARKRGHPQAEAISVCGWIGAFTMGILSPIAFVWAYTKPVMRPIELEPVGDSGATAPVAEEAES